ncbi:VanZ family protein [Adlercreutzia sp. ZJ242]|uniref:VanZ family protein n=1 Tax=Adlercreutzia sp. ZJ242 TaxID=2709409 RepID=UPI0013EBA004|nr:VanZ family protein [Adlercreutzia sp. ZJ242]
MANGEQASRWHAVASWALVIAWAGVIFFMSAHTGSDFDQGTDFVAQVKQWLTGLQMALFGPDVDVISSIAHFCEYTVFGALLQNALRLKVDARRAVAIAIICASLYGVTDEIHQIFVPGRACDPVDWIVDTLGATLGACAWWLMGRRRGA